MKRLIYSLLGILLIGFASADAGDLEGCFGGMMGTSWVNMGFFGWIFGILVFVALVLLIIWLIKQIQKK